MMQATHEAGLAYQKQLEVRLAKLPEEIAEGNQRRGDCGEAERKSSTAVSADGAARGRRRDRSAGGRTCARRAKSFRQPSTASRIHDTAQCPFSIDAISSMKTDLGNAADHIRAQMNGLGKELWRSVAVLVAGGVGIGVLNGHSLLPLDQFARRAGLGRRAAGSVCTRDAAPQTAGS